MLGNGLQVLFEAALVGLRPPEGFAEPIELLPDEPDVPGVLFKPVGDVQNLLLEDLDVVVDQLIGLLRLVGAGRPEGHEEKETCPDRSFKHGLFFDDGELGAPVSLPGRLVVTAGESLALAVGEDLHPVG